MIAVQAHSPHQGEGNRGDVFSCFSLDLDHPACPTCEIIALTDAFESHDNRSFQCLSRARALHPASVSDAKVVTAQVQEVARHGPVSLRSSPYSGAPARDMLLVLNPSCRPINSWT